MNANLLLLMLFLLLGLVSPALAHHPGANLDELMGSKEKFFQVIDGAAPPFELADAMGKRSVFLTLPTRSWCSTSSLRVVPTYARSIPR
jgi:hypothetical protein